VSKTGGSAVFLHGTRRQFDEWLATAPRYDGKRSMKVNLKNLLKMPARPHRDPAQAIINVGREFLETAPR
jgi:hypothetical protein